LTPGWGIARIAAVDQARGMQHRNHISVLFTFVIAAACSRTSPDTSPPETGESVSYESPVDSTEPIADSSHDDEIFGVLEVINDEAIAHGEFMEKWARNQKVKQFATVVVNDHESVRDRQRKIHDALRLNTSDSSLGSEIRHDSRQKLGTMDRLDKGDTLDRAYLDIVVDVHAGWLGAIDKQMVPEAESAELHEELEEVRRIVESHYNMAMALRSELKKKHRH
jgi:putative membrane protein